MNKKEFLEDLRRRLRHLPKEDREDAIAYYEEYLAEMELEEDEDITEKVGKPSEAAREILENCTEKHLGVQKEKGGIKNSATVIWMILLGICASPIAIPIAGTILILFLSCIIVLASLVFAFFCTGAAILAAGILSIPCVFFAAGFPQKLVCLGMGLICLGFGVLFLIGVIKVSEWLIRKIAYIFQKISVRRKVK